MRGLFPGSFKHEVRKVPCSWACGGCSQNYGPISVIDHFTAPNIKGYQSGTLTLGTTHVEVGYESAGTANSAPYLPWCTQGSHVGDPS